MGYDVLTELVVVMAVSVGAAALLRRVHVPPVVGFLVAGVVIGPGGLALVADRHQIELVAEVGVMLLLFTVGLKLKLGDLWRMRRTVFGGGTLQVVVTGTIVTFVTAAFGRPFPEAVVWGAVVSLSSTALVLWLLEGSGDLGTSHGRTVVSILLFQDLAVVPIMLALPVLAGRAASTGEIVGLLGKSTAVMVLTVVVARVIFPWVTRRIVATGSRELFTLTTVLAAVGTALIFGSAGLSMALGAFLAGMVVSESEYVARMIDDITPLRDVFNSLFFVSMGMLVDPRLWLVAPLVTIGGMLAVILVKAVVSGGVAWALLRRPAAAVAAGLGLAQIGEFSVVVAVEAGRLGLLDESARQLFLAIAVPTMVATPFLLKVGSRLVRGAVNDSSGARPQLELAGHVVIVGYGVIGHNVARALQLLDVPHIVVDLNPRTVDEIQSVGGLALEGDARHPEVLEAAGMKGARGLVAAIPDAVSTREVVEAARSLNPEATILARTRFLREVSALTDLGADEVIPEEFETSLELTGRVLRLYGAPPHVVEREKASLRREGYGLLRAPNEGDALHPTLRALCELPGVQRVILEPGSAAAGRTLRQLGVRGRTGATILAIERGDDLRTNPDPAIQLEVGDAVICFADGPAFDALVALLGSESPPHRV